MKLRIERVSPEGDGLGRPDGGGKVFFVPHTAPGDVVEANVTKLEKGFARARVQALLQPGADRVTPRCPLHFQVEKPQTAACGGCDWQHLKASAQLEGKRSMVRDCLFRIAKLREPEVEPTLAAPLDWRYRNKVQVPFGMANGKVVAGFYASGTHRIIDMPDCLVQPELSVKIVLKVKELAGTLGWRIYDEDKGTGWLRHVYVRTNAAGKALAALVTRTEDFPNEERAIDLMREAFPDLVGLHQNVQREKTPVVLGRAWRKLWGEDKIEEKLGHLRLAVSPEAFMQVNTPATELLYALATEMLLSDGFKPSLVLDLYSGIGSIALWIAPKCGRVVGVEENRGAVEDAWANARLNGMTNVRFLPGSVETALGKIRKELNSMPHGVAAAVLDPPRAGCTKPVLKALTDPALGRIVYVSCNPATFARDADWLSRHGWRLARVKPVDLFPQTHHVESVGLFLRWKPRS
ncbi:MAG: 23S rRNA (uracil(1939)-C(5))-methyltransferase RlmD [Elusimicrobia bacterium]|nr:23S rRNA (uracil(1939)-C(5))-methyltransferase RlmD [Elusimicrobiota bacterium]